jgi:hypothetical protein
MNWDIERYVRLYRRDTPEWSLVPWQARGLFDELLRKASLHGVVECGRLEPGQAVAVAIGAPPADVPEVTRLLEILLLDGCVRDVAAAGSHGRHLFIPNYQPANGVSMTGAERQAKYRAKQQGLFGTSDGSDKVTDPSRAEPSREEKHGGEEHREKVSRLRKHPTTRSGLLLRERWPDVVDPDALLSRLASAAPGVDIAGEFEKAWSWERAQPRSSQKKAHERFFTNWVLRAAARAPAAFPSAAPRRVFVGLDDQGRAKYREGT